MKPAQRTQHGAVGQTAFGRGQKRIAEGRFRQLDETQLLEGVKAGARLNGIQAGRLRQLLQRAVRILPKRLVNWLVGLLYIKKEK